MSRLPNIKIDEREFLKMVKRRLRSDLGKYLRRGTIPIDIRGKKVVTIPLDWLEIPSWRYGFPKVGVGQGEGEIGSDLGPVESDEEGEKGRGGQGEGPVTIDIEITIEEFAEIFQEVLELPRIQPKGERAVVEEREKYTTISRYGPHSQIHVTRTYQEALKEAIALGTFKPPLKNVVIPTSDHFRFKSYEVVKEPQNNAVIFFVRDISGSMGPEESRAARYLCSLCSFWLSCNYEGLEEVYIVHHGRGWEVDKEEFFKLASMGGTEASSGHKAAWAVIESRFPPSDWNIYFVYLSDGMNFIPDNEAYKQIMREKILPVANQYNYGEVQFIRPWWKAYQETTEEDIFSEPGTLGHELQEIKKEFDNIALAKVKSGEEMYSSVVKAIQIFFHKGR